ncbi:LacI family DNA-binding transcriptional regulator [Xylocopilactobacillus apis]|nr:LacI family DNA-binding transcriptional regulator [Xylocopilactobacillus apis]
MVNMKDVAKEAGVSLGTVSNYLNQKKLKPETEKRIKKAIKKLHYVRNNAARDLRKNNSSYVVFVLPTVWTPFFSELTFWIQKDLDQIGYKTILCLSENQYEQEKGFVDMAEEQRVAGIISVSYSNITSHVHSGIPLVSIEKEDTGLFSLISSDNYSGGELAASELKKRGASKYFFVGSDNESLKAMTARKSGFVDFCNRNHLEYLLYKISSTSNEPKFNDQLSNVTKKLIDYSKTCDNLGVFAYTDEVAFKLYLKILDQGIKVPDKIQIIGFDGWKLSKDQSLDLSSIRQPIKDIAKNAVRELDSQIKGKSFDKTPRIMLPVSFYSGKTTREVD